MKPMFSMCSALAAIIIGSEIARQHLVGTWQGALVAVVVTAGLAVGVFVLRKRSAARAKAPPPKLFGTVVLAVALFVGIGGISRAILIWLPDGVPEAGLIAGTLVGIAVMSAGAILLADRAAGPRG